MYEKLVTKEIMNQDKFWGTKEIINIQISSFKLYPQLFP